jgi:hypothetical protein
MPRPNPPFKEMPSADYRVQDIISNLTHMFEVYNLNTTEDPEPMELPYSDSLLAAILKHSGWVSTTRLRDGYFVWHKEDVPFAVHHITWTSGRRFRFKFVSHVDRRPIKFSPYFLCVQCQTIVYSDNIRTALLPNKSRALWCLKCVDDYLTKQKPTTTTTCTRTSIYPNWPPTS